MLKKILITILFLCIIQISSFSEAITANDIVAKASHAAYYQGEDGIARVKMVITDSMGRQRKREMSILRKDIEEDKDQKYYVYFHKPNDVKGMTYMVWKHMGPDDDRWLYLPALDLVRRVAAGDKRSSFVGTTFVYEDISGRSVEEDNHELIGEESDKYIIKSIPKTQGSVEFSYFKTWVDKNNFIPVKAEYYDKKEKLYRVIEALKVEDVEGVPTIIQMKALDMNSNTNTISEFSDVKYNVGMKDNIFTERYLRRPPRKYIK
jgi:outer membrane lipoprotein-sorting protein